VWSVVNPRRTHRWSRSSPPCLSHIYRSSTSFLTFPPLSVCSSLFRVSSPWHFFPFLSPPSHSLSKDTSEMLSFFTSFKIYLFNRINDDVWDDDDAVQSFTSLFDSRAGDGVCDDDDDDDVDVIQSFTSFFRFATLKKSRRPFFRLLAFQTFNWRRRWRRWRRFSRLSPPRIQILTGLRAMRNRASILSPPIIAPRVVTFQLLMKSSMRKAQPSRQSAGRRNWTSANSPRGTLSHPPTTSKFFNTFASVISVFLLISGYRVRSLRTSVSSFPWMALRMYSDLINSQAWKSKSVGWWNLSRTTRRKNHRATGERTVIASDLFFRSNFNNIRAGSWTSTTLHLFPSLGCRVARRVSSPPPSSQFLSFDGWKPRSFSSTS